MKERLEVELKATQDELVGQLKELETKARQDATKAQTQISVYYLQEAQVSVYLQEAVKLFSNWNN